MNRLQKVGIRFIQNSKVLTFSCWACIFFASLVVVLMINFFSISQRNYEQNVRESMGGADFSVSTSQGEAIPSEIVQKIKNLQGIEEVAGGYWTYTNIDGLQVYTLGLEDCDMNRHRYQYDAMLQEDKIIINEKLYYQLQNAQVGNSLSLGTDSMEISEILYEDRFSSTNMYMAIVSLTKLHTCLEDGDVTGKNYLMIKKKKKQDSQKLYDELLSVCGDCQVQSVEEDMEFQKSMQSFRIFMISLLVITLIIASLLISSVFQSFLKKYMRDMMILKTIGGNQKQVKKIFMTIVFCIVFFGTVSGLVIGLIGGNIGFHIFAAKLELAEDIIKMDYVSSIAAACLIFAILYLCMLSAVGKYAVSLPLQVKFQNIEKKQKYTTNCIVERVLSKENRIVWKLLLPKMKSNALLLLTIVALTLFSYVSDGMIEQIQKNDTKYYQNIFFSELLVDDNDEWTLTIEDIQQIRECLHKLDNSVLEIYESSSENSQFLLTDAYMPSISYINLDVFYKEKIIDMKQSGKNRIILSKRAAEEIQVKAGDIYEFSYILNGEKRKVKLCIAGILETNIYGDILLDCENDFFKMEDMELFSPTFFLHEYDDTIETTLNRLRIQYPTLSWQSYTQVRENSEKAIKERFLMIRIMMFVLLVLSGIGWLMAAKNMIADRREEYFILRKIGMSERQVKRIIWKQLIPFLMTGIILGTLIGSLVIMYFGYVNECKWSYGISLKSIWFLIVYMIIMAGLLIPTVRKASRLR